MNPRGYLIFLNLKSFSCELFFFEDVNLRFYRSLYSRYAMSLVQLRSALPILALLTAVILTSAPIASAHTIGSDLGLGVASGPPSVASSCFSRGIMHTTLDCVLGSVKVGQIILVEVSDFPPPTVTDTMGDHFALLREEPLPGSTYDLEVYSATTFLSGSVSVNVAGGGGFPAVIAHVIAGAIGVEGVSASSGFSATPEVTGFQPSPGTLLIAAALVQSNLGVLATTISAGPGYTLLARPWGKCGRIRSGYG